MGRGHLFRAASGAATARRWRSAPAGRLSDRGIKAGQLGEHQQGMAYCAKLREQCRSTRGPWPVYQRLMHVRQQAAREPAAASPDAYHHSAFLPRVLTVTHSARYALFMPAPAVQLRTVAAEPGARRCRVCSVFARMSRYGAVSAGTRRQRVLSGAAQSGTSWHVPALADTGKLAEQQTLNMRAHRLSGEQSGYPCNGTKRARIGKASGYTHR
jgi:hypothetical protein